MRAKSTILASFFVGLSLVIWAQEASSALHAGIEVAAGFNQLREGILLPKRHQGMAYQLKYYRENQNKNHRFFSVTGSYSRPKTAYEEAAVSSHVHIQSNWGVFFPMIIHDGYSLWLGPQLETNYRLSYLPKWDDSHLYWADDWSLKASSRVNKALENGNRLAISISMALVSAMNRPPLDRAFKIDDVSFGGILKNMNSDFNLASLPRSKILDLALEYDFDLDRKNKKGLVYRMNYCQLGDDKVHSFVNIQQSIGIKLYFK